MPELLTAAEMRALERATIDAGIASGLELMERAGAGVVAAMLEHWPGLARTPSRAVVLAGPGNNGGDGFVVARELRRRGWEVRVHLAGDMGRLPPDAAENARRWQALGGGIEPLSDFGESLAALGERTGQGGVVVDALFGTGLARPVEGELARVTAAIADRATDRAARVVAIDIPSGIDADSGRPLGAAARATLTVTFHAPKLGHYLAEGPMHCGGLAVADIGLVRHGAAAGARLSDPPAPELLAKEPWAHKYVHGHALVLAGGPGCGGAARLAARAALRVGAGLVTVAPPPAALAENAAQLNAIMLRPVADAGALEALLADRRIGALCLGPNLGVGERTRTLVTAALASGRRVVLDADALTSFADRPDDLLARLHEGCVLTPHLGEFARVFPDIAARLAAPPASGPAFSRADAVREAAARAGAVVLLKGPDTVIGDAAGAITVNAACYERAAPWLATAGAGDVLAGLITGLLARGLAARPAAEVAAWLHVEAARRFGAGLVAEDLPEVLPAVLDDRLGSAGLGAGDAPGH